MPEAEEEKDKPDTKIQIIVGEYKDSGVACPPVAIVVPPERYGWRYWKTFPGIFKILQVLLGIATMACAIPSCIPTQPTYSHICKPKEWRMDADLNLYDKNAAKVYDYCFSSLLFWYERQLTVIKVLYWVLLNGVTLLVNIFIVIQQCRYTTFAMYYKNGLMWYYSMTYLFMDLSGPCAIYSHYYYYQTNKVLIPHFFWVLPGVLCTYVNSCFHGLSFIWNFIKQQP